MLIFVEGIDKTGKDTIVRYINELTNYKYCVLTRGPLSTTAYAKKFNRTDYDESYIKDIAKHSLVVLLSANKKDLDVRFKLTNEPEINKDEDMLLFNNTAQYLMRKYGLKTIAVNTTLCTPFQVATYLKTYLEEEESRNAEKQ